MAIGLAIQRRGRPYFVPKVSGAYDTRLRFQDKFYGVCSTFHYREIAGWARFLGCHTFTVERWKYGMAFPKDDVAQQIIDWDRDGRPWEKVEAWESSSKML